MRGLDGALKLVDVVARTNLSKEKIVKLVKDNVIMARFADFDLDAVFQEAKGDDGDINHKIGNLSMEVRNVIGRIEGGWVVTVRLATTGDWDPQANYIQVWTNVADGDRSK